MISKNELTMSDVKDFLNFFRVYGDVMHHDNEEKVLFTEIENTKQILKMLDHHVRLRAYCGNNMKCVTANDIIGFRRDATEYAYFLSGHIQTENNSLWNVMMANEIKYRHHPSF
eukprot:808056_1